ncbi:MAG TPA: pyroglutamyl-peptidase I [Candidatus Binataceae bacterium]|nr:pyroglutamyl-peptidase I [Candidatus Binataceae bacterium]
MDRAILLTGFEPFGGERMNPSWEVAERLKGRRFGDATVHAVRLPVNCSHAAAAVTEALEELQPVAFLGLGQAGGRPALSLEKVALNLIDEHPTRETDGGIDGQPIVREGPDAYFSRLPLKQLLEALREHQVPAALSLSAGVYICNAVMYVAMHSLRERNAPAGFIHLPYETAQVTRRAAPSMPLDLMVTGIEVVLNTLSSLP